MRLLKKQVEVAKATIPGLDARPSMRLLHEDLVVSDSKDLMLTIDREIKPITCLVSGSVVLVYRRHIT